MSIFCFYQRGASISSMILEKFERLISLDSPTGSINHSQLSFGVVVIDIIHLCLSLVLGASPVEICLLFESRIPPIIVNSVESIQVWDSVCETSNNNDSLRFLIRFGFFLWI
jgi:hypothetical protein